MRLICSESSLSNGIWFNIFDGISISVWLLLGQIDISLEGYLKPADALWDISNRWLESGITWNLSTVFLAAPFPMFNGQNNYSKYVYCIFTLCFSSMRTSWEEVLWFLIQSSVLMNILIVLVSMTDCVFLKGKSSDINTRVLACHCTNNILL